MCVRERARERERERVCVCERERETWPRGYKTFSCSTQLSTKFILLKNVKMPTIVGILTFISMINTTSERHKARKFSLFGILVFISSCSFVLS